MAGALREQALSLIGAANNHGDLAVKLSSLQQAKDILLSIDPSFAIEILPYLVELQCSPQSVLRKSLVQVVEEIGLKAMDYSYILMPILLASLKDSDSIVARQSIVSGTNIFCSVLEELSLQFHRRGIVERWLEELWTWMVRFKDAVFAILLEASSVGTKLLVMKFLETCILLFTADNDSKRPATEEIRRSGRDFNVSWLLGGHPVLDPVALTSEANKYVGILLELLRSASGRPGSFTISIVNCLAGVARKRPLYYTSILSVLLDFDPNLETTKGSHTASVQYSLRTAFLGFLRCTNPPIVESRDRLLRALRAMNAGDAADQVIRQVDKIMKNNERISRDARLIKEDLPPSQLPLSGDLLKRRSLPFDNEDPSYSQDIASKRIRYGPDNNSASPVQISDSGPDCSANGISPKVPLLDSDLSPVEQMIAMIGALIAEGERGVESLEILISQIHTDLLADIVITNMKHLPKSTPPLTRLGSLPIAREGGASSDPTQVVASIGPTSSVQSLVLTPQVPITSSSTISAALPDTSASVNLLADSKRDPRRDPRRLDPRRAAAPVGVPQTSVVDDINATQSSAMQSELDANIFLNKPLAAPVVANVENTSTSLMTKIETDLKVLGSSGLSETDQPAFKDEVLHDDAKETDPVLEVNAALDLAHSPPVCKVDEGSVAPMSSDFAATEEAHTSSLLEADQLSPAISNTSVSEEASPDFPVLPPYVELTEDQNRNVRKLALERIIESYSQLQWTECSPTRMALLSRLVAQIDGDDELVLIMQEHIVSDYQHQKGHELVMHVLYHLHTLIISDSVEHSSTAADVYEKFLLGVAKSLLHNLPATDKSFSRLLGEVPFLPDSALKLLDDVCCSDIHCAKDVRDGDRVTQGLGAVWSLILGRPLNRQACLDIALRCAVHPHDDIRAKAIRLVANKLYVLDYIAESIETFATNMFLSAVDRRVSDLELSQPGSTEQRTEGECGSQETSISGSQISEAASESDYVKGAQSDSRIDSSVSFAQAQRLISLLFALCTKKPSLLRLVFDNFARATKAVKQAVHRHIPILIRALGSSHSELLCLISDPPEGSENLLMQVVNILSKGTTPSSDLIASVIHLYETKLKDVTILIPMLSSLSKNEVLPIFPRLVDLPLDQFQRALAHILQGSAHTGPALTPAEVLVAIHDINPEKDRLALKKITDVCSACFEQRTVFTQQVLAKALNQMVDQSPLPLLFMRTVIQAIDAFPTLVDFVMEILSKLVNKQVWRMPKLWVGFLKCISQTQPHSFHVLLQLPSPQLESALTKYANLRGPLAAYARQPSIRSSLSRSTLVLLGLAKESHVQQPTIAASLHASDSSVQGATLT